MGIEDFSGSAATSGSRSRSRSGRTSGGGSADLTSEELLLLAQARGGKVGQIANELGGGKRTILSTIGNAIKTTFNDFVDVISAPGQIVAGMISKDFTIAEAVKENLRVSDVIFGDTNIFNKDGDPTTMQKIGDFIVRLPADILTDPLTYLTFGSHRAVGVLGKMGFGANSKVSLYKQAAAGLGKNIDDGEVISRALSDFGQDVMGFTKKYEDALIQKSKTTGLVAKEAKDALMERGLNKEVLDQIENNVKGAMKATIDSPFNPDIAKKTLSNILESNPALTKTFIDKGGIKFFGKTLLEGQRINNVMAAIPGMKWVDNVTLPYRNSALALFDRGLVKTGDNFTRIPEEFIQSRAKLQSLVESKNIDFVRNLADVQKSYNLNKNELDILTDSLNTSVIPADAKLQGAYYQMNGIREDMVGMLRDAGIPVSKMDNWVGLITVPNDTKFLKGNSMLSKEVGATKQAQNIKAVPIQDQGVVQALPEVQNALESIESLNINKSIKYKNLTDEIFRARTVEDVTKAIGKERDSLFSKLKKEGLTGDEIFKNKEYKKLEEAQKFVKDLKTEGSLVGTKQTVGLTLKNTDEEIAKITKEADDTINKLNISKESFENEIALLADGIYSAQLAKVGGNFDSFLRTLPPESRSNAKVLLQRIEDYVGKPDLEKLKANVLKPKSAEDVAKELLKANKSIDYDDLLIMAKKILKDESVMPVDVENLNKFLKESLKESELVEQTIKEAGTNKEVVKKVISEDMKNKIAQMYEQSGAIKFKIARENLDGNALSKFIEILKEEFVKDPGGARRLINSMVKRESKLNDVIQLIDETRISTQRKLGLLPEEMVYFTNNEGQVYKRVATTAQELREAGFDGFDDNLLTAWTVRGMQNIRQSLGHQFAEGLVRNFGRWADEAPESWVSMSSALVNDNAKQLAGGFVRNDGVEMMFHPAVAKSFDDMMMGLGKGDEATSGFLKGFDKLQRYYKSYLTTLFPMFHGRNAISNVLLNFLDVGTSALNPKRHFMAAQMIVSDRKINKLMRIAKGSGDDAIKALDEISQINSKKMFTDRVGHEWTFGELRTVVRDNNVAFNPNITGALDIRNDRESLAKFYGIGQTRKQQIASSINPLNVEQFKLTRGGQEVGRVIEEQSRMINFISNLIDTGDVTHAAQRTKQFLFDYQNGLTSFEKNVMRRLIPFYSFTRFNLELQAKTLLSAPGKIAMEIKAVQSLGSIMGGEPMSKDEVDLLPTWMKNNLNLKRRTEDGKYEILSGFGTPIEQPFQAFQGNTLMGSLSPIIKFPVEKMTGYNLFRGKMTSQVTDAEMFRVFPEPVKQFIGYVEWEGVDKQGKKYTVYKSLRPERMHTLLSMPYGRFISTVGSMTDKDVSGDLRTLGLFTGIQARPFEEEQLASQREREMAEQLERLLRDSGIRGQYIRGYNKNKTQLIEN